MPHELPVLIKLQLLVEELGWQVWHLLAGLVELLAYTMPPMKHPLMQDPAEQTCPLPQSLPLVLGLHAEVDAMGWQVWHEFTGLLDPLA